MSQHIQFVLEFFNHCQDGAAVFKFHLVHLYQFYLTPFLEFRYGHFSGHSQLRVKVGVLKKEESALIDSKQQQSKDNKIGNSSASNGLSADCFFSDDLLRLFAEINICNHLYEEASGGFPFLSIHYDQQYKLQSSTINPKQSFNYYLFRHFQQLRHIKLLFIFQQMVIINRLCDNCIIQEIAMLSKQEKLKYGELLRQQIKQNEEQKRFHKREQKVYQQEAISVPQPLPSHQQPPERQQIHQIEPFRNDRESKKEQLAKRMEQNNYNPFGKIGGGAPNKPMYNQQARQQQNYNYNNEDYQPQKRFSSIDYQHQDQNSDRFNVEPIGINPQQMQIPIDQRYKRINTPQFLQGAYNNAKFISPQFAPPAPYGYVNGNDNGINYMGKLNFPNQKPTYVESPYNHMPNYPPEGYMQQQLKMEPPQAPMPNNQANLQEIKSDNRDTNQIYKQVFRKGGRNLLKFENEVPDKIIEKQNQKLRLQQQLKKQMQEVARRKQEEERKNREADELLEKKNREFLQMQKKRYEQELKSKKGQSRNMDQENSNNAKGKVAEAGGAKRQKFQKIRQEVAKREEDERRQMEVKQKQNRNIRIIPPPRSNKFQSNANDLDQVHSAISNETAMSRGFNTAISKEFFQKERERNGEKGKIDKIAQQMQKMRRQIANQGQRYHQQISKVQMQSEKVRREKAQADQQIMKLKQQIKQKMESNNQKFLGQIYDGKVKLKDPYYADQVKVLQKEVGSLRQGRNQNLVLSEYQAQNYKNYDPKNDEALRNDSDMMSLIGDSKKIPLNIQTNETLSISKLQGFAKDTDYFRKEVESPLQNRYRVNNSIAEVEDEERAESKQSKRPKMREQPREELDMLVERSKQSRGGWGQMSSVNDEVVNEIEKMLQVKQRPKSHLSSVGQKSLLSYQNEQLMSLDAHNEDAPARNRKSTSVSRMPERKKGEVQNLDELLNKYMQR